MIIFRSHVDGQKLHSELVRPLFETCSIASFSYITIIRMRGIEAYQKMASAVERRRHLETIQLPEN